MSVQPLIRGPQDGEKVYAVGTLHRYLADKSETGGSYSLIEVTVPPHSGPPPHLHHREDEAFYILEGQITVYLDDEPGRTLIPGTFIHLPRDRKHFFQNHTDQSAKLLVLVAPGGFEEMFRVVGKSVPASTTIEDLPPMTLEEQQHLLAVAPNYGVDILVPSPV